MYIILYIIQVNELFDYSSINCKQVYESRRQVFKSFQIPGKEVLYIT